MYGERLTMRSFYTRICEMLTGFVIFRCRVQLLALYPVIVTFLIYPVKCYVYYQFKFDVDNVLE